jgi:hypothetical protein
MTDRHQITSHVQLLESDRVKAIVLDWLAGTSGSLDDFEQLLEADYAVVAPLRSSPIPPSTQADTRLLH